MPGFVKTAADEQNWEKAKEVAHKKFGEKESDNFWAYSNAVFHAMKGGKHTESVDPELTEESQVGLLNNPLQEETWKHIKHYVFNHPVYGELPESEKYDLSEGVFLGYINENTELNLDSLYEFTNSYVGGGMSTSAGTYGFGGGRDEAPIGPIVYGLPGTYGPGRSYSGMGFGNEKPATVITPAHNSNYEPWKQELDTHGNVVSDVKRSVKDGDWNTEWIGPVGDVVEALEDLGLDANEFSDMTEEEIEDLIIKALKKETSMSADQDLKQAVGALREFRSKINEAFGYRGESLEEEAKRNGRIHQAREILANKHQQRKALDKEDGERKYALNQYDIERLMTSYGYVFSYELLKWVKKAVAPKQKSVYGSAAKPVAQETEPDAEVGNDSSAADKAALDDQKAKEKEEKEKLKIANDPLHDPAIKAKIKSMQARFLLALGHGDKLSTEFKENEKGEKLPTIPDDQILAKIDLLQYTWNPDKLSWYDSKMTYPNPIFNAGESNRTIVARSYLAAKDAINNIKVNAEGHQAVSPEKVNLDMENKGFQFDSEKNKWEYEGTEEKPKDELTETLTEEANKILAPKDNQSKIERDFSPNESLDYQARFLLKAVQIAELQRLMREDRALKEATDQTQVGFDDDSDDDVQPQQSQNKPKAEGSKTVQQWRQYMIENDPTTFARPNKTDKPTMDVGQVVAELKKLGYTANPKDPIAMWTKGGSNSVPDILKPYQEDAQSFTGRGVLTAKYKDPRYISFRTPIDNIDNSAPIETPERVRDRVEESNRWDKKNGWLKIGVGDRDEDGRVVDAEQAEYHSNDRKVLDQFKDANWDYMSYSQKQKFKEVAGKDLAIRELGLQQTDWPTGNSSDDNALRKLYLRKFSQNFKFTVDQKTGVKGWQRRQNPVTRSLDKVGIKAAIGSVARKLTASTKFAAKSMGVLGQVLKFIGNEAR